MKNFAAICEKIAISDRSKTERRSKTECDRPSEFWTRLEFEPRLYTRKQDFSSKPQFSFWKPLKTGPFIIRTTFNHPNTELLWYLDGHYNCPFIALPSIYLFPRFCLSFLMAKSRSSGEAISTKASPEGRPSGVVITWMLSVPASIDTVRIQTMDIRTPKSYKCQAFC